MHRCTPLVPLIGMLVCSTAFGQTRAIPLSELGADLVAIKKGPRLLGAVLGKNAEGTLSVAVERGWLEGKYPKLFDEESAREIADARKLNEELRDRLDEWRREREESPRLLGFLKDEAARVERLLGEPEKGAKPAASQFMLLRFDADQVERTFIQPPPRKQVALVAWRERLDGVESRPAADLSRELTKRGLRDANDAPIDLSDRLPPQRQSEKEWAARRALVEYAYHKSLDFQGTGDLLVKTGDEKKALDLGQIFTAVLQSQLLDLFDPLADKKPREASRKGLDSATRTAESEELRGFRVTRVNQDLASGRVSVETQFVAQLPGPTWQPVWSSMQTLDATKPRGDLEKRILADPQVSKALDLIKSTGVLGSDKEINTALRFGAATMEAQQNADTRFFEFRDKYTRRLDGPPLMVP